MIEGMEDRQYAKFEQRSDRIIEKMREMTKKEKPVFQEPVKPIDRLYAFDQMTEEDVQNIIFNNGQEFFMQMTLEMDKIRRKLGGQIVTR